jgi:hypothetical protein
MIYFRNIKGIPNHKIKKECVTNPKQCGVKNSFSATAQFARGLTLF